jgi:hypothetical protein
MGFSNIDTMAVFWAAVAGFIFGGLWYGLLSRVWMEAAGLSEEKIKASGPNPAPFVLTFVALFVIGITEAVIFQATNVAGPLHGAIAGVLLAAGFVATTIAVNHTFQGARRMLTLIDTGHWLGVFAIQGAMIGWLASP